MQISSRHGRERGGGPRRGAQSHQLDGGPGGTGRGGPREHGALRWIVSARAAGPSLPFPDAVAPADADAMLADCRARDQRGIGCWTSGLDPIGEIAAVLVARGFEWGWSAHWISFDLDALPRIDDDRVRVEPGPVRDSWRATAAGARRSCISPAARRGSTTWG